MSQTGSTARITNRRRDEPQRPDYDAYPRRPAMKVLLIAAMALGFWTALPWPVAADLDPAIQADLHLVQAEDYIKQKNYAAAHEAMGRILALQKTHDLTIPDEFHFKYAQILDLAGEYEQAVEAATRYLNIAGRDGAHYRDALTLLHKATQRAQKAAEAEAAANAIATAAAKAEAEAKARAEVAAVAVVRNMSMVVVPDGSYMMGSPSEHSRRDNELPQHRVTIREPFAVGVYEVTFEEWDACVSAGGCDGYTPEDSGWGRGRRPVINVSWNDAQRFLAWLRKVTGEPYRLLSEAEWEYVARAGTTTPFYTGLTISTSQANYQPSGTGVFRQQPVEVGSFPPNSFGLYDVHGNVGEWVEDCWNDTYRGAPSDGRAWTSGDCSARVVRGGSWNDFRLPALRSAYRRGSVTGGRHRSVGFRVARALTADDAEARARADAEVEARAGAAAEAAARTKAAAREMARNIAMVVVPAGSYLMGSASEDSRDDNEGPRHRVTIREPFAVGVHEVTFEEWDACVNAGGCQGYAPDDKGWGRGRRPVIYVSWEDAQRFVAWLRTGTGEPYRLLSEAEWEYVARSGTTTAFHTGATISTSQAAYGGHHGLDSYGTQQTVDVMSFRPNGFGLYDVHGNVAEWVQDCWNDSYRGAPSDGSAWERGDCDNRVVRGGSWFSGMGSLRSASRWSDETYERTSLNGFRIARTLTP